MSVISAYFDLCNLSMEALHDASYDLVRCNFQSADMTFQNEIYLLYRFLYKRDNEQRKALD